MITVNNWSFERKTYTWSSRKSSHSMKSGGFHPWNPYEIRWISPVKSILNLADFTWNLADFTHEIRMKSTGFHEIRMKSAGFRKTIARNGKPYVSLSFLFKWSHTMYKLHYSTGLFCYEVYRQLYPGNSLAFENRSQQVHYGAGECTG